MPACKLFFYSGFDACFAPSTCNVGCWNAKHISNHQFSAPCGMLGAMYKYILPVPFLVYIQRERVPSVQGGTAALEPCSCKPLTTCTCFCEAVYQLRRVAWFSSNFKLPMSEPERLLVLIPRQQFSSVQFSSEQHPAWFYRTLHTPQLSTPF